MNWENNIAVLACAAVVLMVANAAIEAATNRYAVRQQILEIPSTASAKPRIAVLAWRIGFALLVFGFATLLRGIWIPIYAGGYVVVALLGFTFGIQGLVQQIGFGYEPVRNEKISFSKQYTYINSLGSLLSVSLLTLGLYALFGKMHFLGAGCFYLLSALGRWSRSPDIVRTAEQPR